jgi:hypothetical protein
VIDTSAAEQPELVVPATATIDRIAVDRLHTQLALHGDDVVAVVAPFATVPSGCSFRTVAEHASLLPLSVAEPAEVPAPGVALVRAGVHHEMKNSRLTVARGAILVDPGATSHDPTAEPAVGPVSSGRSAFPRAPIVLFIGLEHESGRAVWARDMVNRLFDHDVEGRLATTPVASVPHLSAPCPCEVDTLHALEPDIVVTLDDTALATVPAWCDRRSTVIVHHTGERTLSTELVSWRIGATFGRVRAYIGSAVEPHELAALCSRLCAGPFPAPPTRDGIVRPTPALLRRPTRAPRRVAVVRGAAPLARRLQNFVDEARAQGADATDTDLDDASGLVERDVVLLASDVDPTQGRALIDQRADQGRRTIVDIDEGPASLALARHAGRATAPTTSTARRAHELGIHTMVLPHVVTRVEADELRRARGGPTRGVPPRLGVVCERSDVAVCAALEAAVCDLLQDDPDLLVDAVDAACSLARLRAHERVTVLDGSEPADLVGWRTEAWLGSPVPAGEGTPPRPLLRAGLAGVPMVLSADTCGEIDDDVVVRWAVAERDDPQAWLEALREALVADDTALLALRTELLYGPKAGGAMVNRILGWAGSPEARP